MSSISNDRSQVFAYLASQSGIQLSTSATINGIVRENYVVVHTAPPVAVQEIVKRFRLVSLTEDGLLIPTE